MHGYQVDVDELWHKGNLVSELGERFADSPSLKYSMASGEVGDEELAGALTEFQDGSLAATAVLRAVAAEAAARLHDTARTYLEGERASTDAVDGRIPRET